ncbi:DUF4382 domain-containing protein [Thermotoga caldifontis]|uniref:DUF4382 domain-containing protein n=1 Tax=Thermotoga caldifontis TaxID=1508419 RepID=UPI000597C0D7|nr:DUF4382 domain-containing protein [Thermotoga caldifontis]
MRKTLLVLVGITIALVLASCALLSWSQPSVKVYLTDAVLPIENVERILVTIDRILLLSEDATVVVSDEATTVNLLDLVGQELYVGSVPEGTYGQLRFEISSATITVSGTDYPLRISSGSLKYNLQGFHVTAGTSIVLDFDLSRSIKVTGSATSSEHGNNPVQYHMTPVIHVRYGQLYDITGRVVQNDQGLAHALVALFETRQPSPTAVTLTHKASAHWQAGEFKLCKVQPSDYELKIYTNWQSAQDPEYIFELTPATTLTVTVKDKDVNLGDINIQ